MPAPSTILKNSAAATVGSVVAGIGYASLIERNAFVVREVTMPVLAPGSSPLRVLHISDIHMRPKQRRKQAWLRELARWEPDLVVNTGDNLAHPKAVPAVVQTLGDLLSVPGLFVFGSNDYFGPRLKNPANYLTDPGHRVHGQPLPWQDLRAAFTERGWLDMTHNRREIEVAGLRIAVAGVDDPHLKRDRYETIAGPASPDRGSAPGADALAGAAGAGSLRRRRLSAGDGRPYPRRTALPAVLRRDRHQLRPGPVAGQGRVALGREHGAARLGGYRHVAVRPGAVLLPARGHAVDAGGGPDRRPRRRGAGRASPTRPYRHGDRPRLDRRSQPATPVGGQCGPVDRGRRPAQRRHPSVALSAAVGVVRRRGRAAVSQGRDDPYHRQPQTPVGAVVVSLRAVQRLDR